MLFRIAWLSVALVAFAPLGRPNVPPVEHRYFFIDGPDYRRTTRETFASYARDCNPTVVRRYPDVGVVAHLCYL